MNTNETAPSKRTKKSYNCGKYGSVKLYNPFRQGLFVQGETKNNEETLTAFCDTENGSNDEAFSLAEVATLMKITCRDHYMKFHPYFTPLFSLNDGLSDKFYGDDSTLSVILYAQANFGTCRSNHVVHMSTGKAFARQVISDLLELHRAFAKYHEYRTR